MNTRLLTLFVILIVAPVQAGEPNLTGRWRGNWESSATGHSGPLRARFRQMAPDQYRVVFTGRFFKIIPFRYAETLTVTSSDGTIASLSGSSRLLGFGTFSFSAVATSQTFTADFQSRNESGVFKLSR